MKQLTGTVRLTLLGLKRDRFQLPIWILVTTAVLAASIAIYDDIYPTDADLRTATEFYAGNPVGRMLGLPSAVNLGAYTLVEVYVFLAAIVALMSVLAVVRHTREAEETRQAEMLISTAIGRHALLAAALCVAVVANAATGLFVAIVFMAYGLGVAGPVAAGATVMAVGLCFASVAAVTVQVSSSSRGASGMAIVAIGAAVVFTAFGGMLGTIRPNGVTVDPAWPAWLSPISWGQLVRPFGGNDWVRLLPAAAFIAACNVLAFALIDRRDLGRGIMAERRGPAGASATLLNPFGLAWRLQRGLFFGWAGAIVLFGVMVGAILGDVEESLGDLDFSDLLERIGGTEELLDAYTVAVTNFFGSAISAYSVQVVLRLRGEEANGPLEAMLGTPLSRTRWMLTYVVNAVLGTLALLLLMGLSIGIAAGITLGGLAGWVADLLGAALVQAPAVFAIGGFAVLAFALVPQRAGALSWAFVIVAVVAGPMLGETLRLPDVVTNLSPFTHTPRLPVAEFEAGPLVVLLAIAAAATIAGFARFRRRDLAL